MILGFLSENVIKATEKLKEWGMSEDDIEVLDVRPYLIFKLPYELVSEPRKDGYVMYYKEFYKAYNHLQVKVEDVADVVNGGESLERLHEKIEGYVLNSLEKGRPIPVPKMSKDKWVKKKNLKYGIEIDAGKEQDFPTITGAVADFFDEDPETNDNYEDIFDG